MTWAKSQTSAGWGHLFIWKNLHGLARRRRAFRVVAEQNQGQYLLCLFFCDCDLLDMVEQSAVWSRGGEGVGAGRDGRRYEWVDYPREKKEIQQKKPRAQASPSLCPPETMKVLSAVNNEIQPEP